MSWPLEIDGREYQPIPESWIEAGVDDGFGDPRLYAVSAAVESRQMLVVRYAHPSNPGVLWASMQGTDGSSGGTIPSSLPRRSWPRSLVPGRHTEPTGVIRDAEREHLEELWADRIQKDDDETDRQLVADGGTDQPDPEDDPFACSICGCYLGELKRVRGDDYCDACSREHGAKPPIERCSGCGHEAPQDQMVAVDISPEDEYYPEIRYFCRGCSGGERA